MIRLRHAVVPEGKSRNGYGVQERRVAIKEERTRKTI